MNITIIGCGGTGGRFAALVPSIPDIKTLHLIDGDTFEPRNRERQIGATADAVPKPIGLRDAIHQTHPDLDIQVCNGYLGAGEADEYLDFNCPGSVLVLAVDNYGARRRALSAFYAQPHRFPLLLVPANRYWDAHAVAQLPAWDGTAQDIRIMYPEIMTREDDFDPAAPDCNQQAVESAPQLALTNQIAADLALSLLTWYHVHCNEELQAYLDKNPEKQLVPFEHLCTNGVYTTNRGVLAPRKTQNPKEKR